MGNTHSKPKVRSLRLSVTEDPSPGTAARASDGIESSVRNVLEQADSDEVITPSACWAIAEVGIATRSCRRAPQLASRSHHGVRYAKTRASTVQRTFHPRLPDEGQPRPCENRRNALCVW